MIPNLSDEIGGLIWYAECKALALDKICSFIPPADTYELRMYHSLYLINLLALLDRGKELFGQDVETAWVQSLDGLGGLSGENNAGYVRELRNAVIHRGLDITTEGSVIDGKVCAMAPQVISDRRGRTEPRQPFAPLLRTVFEACDDKIGPLVLSFAGESLKAIECVSIQEFRARYLNEIDASLHMPAWAKGMARASIDQLPFEELRTLQLEKLRKLLSRT